WRRRSRVGAGALDRARRHDAGEPVAAVGVGGAQAALHHAHGPAVQRAVRVGHARQPVAAVGRERAVAARLHAAADEVAARDADLVGLAAVLGGDARAAVVAHVGGRARAYRRRILMADVAGGIAGVGARRRARRRAVRFVGPAARADLRRVGRIGHAHHLSCARQPRVGIAAAAVAVDAAGVALHVAARRRLADRRAEVSERPAEVAAARAAAVAGLAVDGAGGVGERRAGADGLARDQLADAGAALVVVRADVADLGAERDLRRRRALADDRGVVGDQPDAAPVAALVRRGARVAGGLAHGVDRRAGAVADRAAALARRRARLPIGEALPAALAADAREAAAVGGRGARRAHGA